MPVADIKIRGRGDADEWVTSFKLQVSNDCLNWTWAESESKIYHGNYDRNTIVTNKLPSPIKCKAIRIVPWEWHVHISMRCDVVIIA
jgi:hypothetical protein